jgi:ketosteroid isomerase-like protein
MEAADSQIEHDVRRMSSEWVNALIQRDTATLARIMAWDCTFTYPHGYNHVRQSSAA